MRIRIETTDSTSLPLVGELPDWPLARMEGYNGIGKSLTVRLLQICTGVQPYRAARAWEGLRNGLGACEIRVDALADGGEIRWAIDARRWPVDLQPIGDDWDGLEVEVNGRRASLAEVAKLLSVHRLAGDVGLAETLGEQVEADRLTFEKWSSPLTDAEKSPLRAVEDRFGAAADLVGRVDIDATARAREALARTGEELERERESLARHTARQTALADALELRSQLTQARGAGQAADERIAAIDSELSPRNERRAELVEQIATLEAEAARSKEAATELERARRRHGTHQDKLDAALRTLVELADRIGIDPQELAAAEPVEDLDARLAALRAEAQADLDGLLERRAAIDAAPMMSSLLGDLAGRLAAAEDAGLGRQPLLDPSDGVALTVAELRDRLEQRRGTLGARSPSEQGVALGERIERAVERLRAFDDVPGVRDEIARRSRLAGDADEAIRKLVAAVDSSAAQRLEELVRRRHQLDAEIHALSYERTSLLKRRRPPDIETLEERLEAAVRAAGTSVPGLADELQVQAAAARDAQVAFDRAADAARGADETAAEHHATLQRVVRALNDDADLEWLRQANRARVPRVDDDPGRQVEALAALAVVLSRASDRAGRARGQVQGISAALRALHDRLAGHPAGVAVTAYLEEVTNGYGIEFARWFDEEHVRNELFGDAARVSDVDLHADRLEVVWETSSGDSRARPLEAFSRGEQAFAYTRARLASLDNSLPRARNRLIVLDEFGAFIAHDRLSRLIEMLAERRDRRPDDQHLLVLPLANDYAEAARTAPVGERDGLERKANDLRDRGFVIEQL